MVVKTDVPSIPHLVTSIHVTMVNTTHSDTNLLLRLPYPLDWLHIKRTMAITHARDSHHCWIFLRCPTVHGSHNCNSSIIIRILKCPNILAYFVATFSVHCWYSDLLCNCYLQQMLLIIVTNIWYAIKLQCNCCRGDNCMATGNITAWQH